MVAFFRIISAFFMAITTLISYPVAGNISADFAPKDEENVKLTFATVSDTHMKDSATRAFMLELGLSDMENSDYRLDALVHAGDITDHAYEEQWQKTVDVFSKYDPADNIILSVGNHDTWGSDEDDRFPESQERFMKYAGQIMSKELEKTYYSTKVNGYTFVVMSSEDDGTDAYVSDEQIAWLDATMAEAAADGLPIFVVFHQPINNSHGLPVTWGDDEPEPMDGGIGEQSEKVEAVLQKYKNVIYISGHLHLGMGDKITPKLWDYRSVETYGNITSVNLPCYMYFNPMGQIMSGTGFVFEVYDDYVLVRGRSYSSNVWYTAYEYTIDLT